MAKPICRVHWGVDEGVYTDFEGLNIDDAKDKALRFLDGYCRGEGWIELVDETDAVPVAKTKVIPMRPFENPDGDPIEAAVDEMLASLMPKRKSA